MARDRDFSRRAILRSAEKHFLEHGFEKASMREIAKEAKLTVGALYKHFASKADLFDALVGPTLEGAFQLYNEELEVVSSALEQVEKVQDCFFDMDSTTGILKMLAYIYEHYDAFDLMFNRSRGTKYEQIQEIFVDMEIRGTKKCIQAMEMGGVLKNPFSEKELHIFCTMCMTPMFEVIYHQYTYEEAVSMVKLMSYGQCCAWNQICQVRNASVREEAVSETM